MEARAIGRYLRVTPRKARLVLDAVRGKSADEALGILKFTPNEAAKYIRRLLESAIANAENNYSMDRDTLRLVRAYADNGPMLKRIHPRAMGRAFRIMKRMSHITVIVEEDEALRAAVAKTKPKPKRATRRTKEAPAPPAAEPKAKKKAAKPEKKAEEKPEVEAPVEEIAADQIVAKAPVEEVVVEQTAAESPAPETQADAAAPEQTQEQK
jgi:large subunit ribosomal protein L22